MYKLTRRENLIWFLLTIVVCLAVSIALPQHFPQQRFEIPGFALLSSELALVIIFSVFCFENASPCEQFRLAFTMLAMTMLTGAISNVIGQTSQVLPDGLLVNWVQLLCMNVTGLASTLALYKTKAGDAQTLAAQAPRPAFGKTETTDQSQPEEDLPERADLPSGESAQDILDQLDVSRINRLEKRISQQHQQKEGEVSIESLFAEESNAAKGQSSAQPAAISGPPESVPSLPPPRAASLDDLLSGDDMPAVKFPTPAKSEAIAPVFAAQPPAAVSVAAEKPAPAAASAPPAESIQSGNSAAASADDQLIAVLDFPMPTLDAASAANAAEAVANSVSSAIETRELISSIDNLFSGLDLSAPPNASDRPPVKPAIDMQHLAETVDISRAVAEAQITQLAATLPTPPSAEDKTSDSPAPNAVASAAEPSEAASAAEPAASLFDEGKLVGELDDIFSSLAPGVCDDAFSAEKLASLKSPAPAAAPPPPPSASDNKLFDDGLGGDIDSIFDNLAPDANNEVADLLNLTKAAADNTPAASQPAACQPIAEAPAAPASAPPAAPASAPPAAPAPAATSAKASPQPAAKPAAPAGAGAASTGGKEVKEFGRLSAAATAKVEPSAPGTLKTIGQMLLDTQAVENIIKRAENRSEDMSKAATTTAKVVTVSRGADIQQMLNKVAGFPGIDGCLVIGKDGLLIGATESLGMMRDVLGVLALGIHSTTGLGTKKVDLGELRQSILRTGEKLTILVEIGIGLLACFCDHFQLETIDAMLDHVHGVIADSQASGGTSLPMETLSSGMLAGATGQPEAAPQASPPTAPQAPAAVAQPVAAPPQQAAVPISQGQGGLFSVDDDDIGGLFDEILTDSTVHNDAIRGGNAAATASAVPAAAPAAAPAAQPSSAPPAGAPLLSVDDQLIGDIFDNLLEGGSTPDPSIDFSPPGSALSAAPAAVPPAVAATPPAAAATTNTAQPTPPAPVAAAPASPTPAATPPAAAPATASGDKAGASGQQIKEFGRLSISAANKSGTEDGAIKAIGRQLIDVQAVENIIKAGEKREKMGSGLTTARVISAARGEGIKALLTKIDGCSGVAGSLIVGNDGLVIASTLVGGLDKDLLGALCTAMHSHSELALKKLDMGKLKQIIFHSHEKTTILTAVAVGVLAVFVDSHNEAGIDSLLGAIEQTVRG